MAAPPPGRLSQGGRRVYISGMGTGAREPRVASPKRPPRPVDSVELGARADDMVPPRIAEALKRAGRVYYDPSRDRRDAQDYYAGLEDGDPAAFFRALSDRVSATHVRHLGYEPDEYLYRWVDLRPNLRLQSLYSTLPVPTDSPVRVTGPEELQEVVHEPIPESTSNHPARKSRHGKKGRHGRKAGRAREVRTRKVVRSLEEQARQWVQALAAGPTDAVQIAQRIAELETRSYFNCEHVVPRVWFDDRQPMRGDLHHLFTAEAHANGNRSSRRLVELEDYDGSRDPSQLGKAPDETTEYEPAGGKGAAARATLYFLLRYPGKVGNDQREYRLEDLETLLRWHREDPPSLYERHRNQEIFKLQGNRNPLIDHPEWAERIDFSRGVGTPFRPPPRRRREPPPWQRDHRHH
ncbi:MAG: endonuclease [Armatimonadetes bacterium]|nr:endonuclease [Armatimonadota bacterium]